MNPFLLTAWIACQTFDVTTTRMALNRGGREMNPIMRRGMVPLKLSVNLFGILVYRKTHEKALPIAFSIGGCAAGSWNTYQLRRRR